jgi:hypothetical protein
MLVDLVGVVATFNRKPPLRIRAVPGQEACCMRANPAGNWAFSGRPRTFVLLNGSVAHKGLFHAGKLPSNCILRSLILLGIGQQQRSQLSSQTQTGVKQ